MSTSDASFSDRMLAERARQIRKYSLEHDDAHTYPEWGLLLLRMAGRVADFLEELHSYPDEPPDAMQSYLMQLATVCLALDEAVQRKDAR